jgi:hypothetical protein
MEESTNSAKHQKRGGSAILPKFLEFFWLLYTVAVAGLFTITAWPWNTAIATTDAKQNPNFLLKALYVVS